MPRFAPARTSLAVACALALSVSCAHAASGELASPDSASLHLVIEPAKRSLMGPDPFFEPLPGLEVLGFATGTIGGIVAGYLLDGVVDQVSKNSDEEVPEALDAAFDFDRAVQRSMAGLGSDAVTVDEIHTFDYGDSTRANARRILGAYDDADLVGYYEPTYFITPGLDRVRLVVKFYLYGRKGDSSSLVHTFVRRYEYLSASRGEVLRPFRPGEKEALIAEIDAHVAARSERWPRNAAVYEKDRRRAVKELERRTLILPLTAMKEGWPGDSMKAALEAATAVVTGLIRADIRERNASGPPPGRPVDFDGLDLHGKPATFEGHRLREIDAHTVWRDVDGNVYALPGDAPFAAASAD